MAVQGPFTDKNTEESIKSLSAGGRITDVLYAEATLNFSSIAANASADLTVTVSGARVRDMCMVTPSSGPGTGIQYTAFVTSNNTVTVRAGNNSTGAVDPTAQLYRVLVWKFAEGV